MTITRMANAKYDPAERRARYLASKSNPEKLERHRSKNRKWATDFRKRMYSDPEKLAAFKSKQQWERIKLRVEEDGDVIGADEFRTPDGLIYYAVGCMIAINGYPFRKAERLERRLKLKAFREKHSMTIPEKKMARRARMTAYQRNRRRTMVREKILNALRCRLGSCIRKLKTKKCQRTVALLGCSIDALKLHLESRFTPGMNWSNFGRKKGIQCWEIDHILPCASFDLTDPEQQRKCFHFTNLQPLWATDNRSKSDRVDSPLTPTTTMAT